MNRETTVAAASPPNFRPSKLQALGLFVAAASLGVLGFMADPVSAAAPAPAPAPAPGVVVDPPPVPEGLKGVPVPEPTNLAEFVLDRAAAVRLGKALFWDMQLGSDGQTACASCHFHAGADTRSRNQVSPGLKRMASPTVPNPDTTFQVGGPNYQFKAGDFPFHKFADPNNRASAVVRTHNDVASSMGVFNTNFVGVTPGATADNAPLAGDPVFQLNGLQTRRVEPRNTPSFINSVFNFRNFFDGRAAFLFNGATPFGAMDPTAKVYKAGTLLQANTATQTTVRIDKASLASLATGPALSDLEMSGAGRTWPEIGKRLLTARPLVQQAVNPSDSALAVVRHVSGVGLNGTYHDMVKAAFKPEWWRATNTITINGKPYSQMQANFSLFFGLAIQMYGATQVSDDSPFDRHMAGNTTAMSTDAKLGLAVFFGKGKCAECHNGAEFTTAATRNILKGGPLSRMVMGNGATAVYDEGFYNTAVKQTLEDISNGARNPFRPMSTAKLAQEVGSAEFQRLIGVPANLVVAPGERLAINGAFKTPGLRNVELTAPYFHNGDSLTLEQTVEFYNRGGNHFQNNIADVDAEIVPLGLTAAEKAQLVAFMKALTDDRVRLTKAPFDHPELRIPDGHVIGSNGLPVLENGRAKETFKVLPAVGGGGTAAPRPDFLNDVGFFSLVASHSGKCVDISGASTADAGNVQQWDCHAAGNQLWEQVPATNGFMLRNRHSGKCMDVSGISLLAGANIYQWSCHGGPNQVFNWVGSRLKVNHSGQCVNVTGASQANAGNIIQWPCTTTATNDQFTKR